jgi:lipopolysaccharide/colanic/teichoic acid biosynthesis glycosyltransferase
MLNFWVSIKGLQKRERRRNRDRQESTARVTKEDPSICVQFRQCQAGIVFTLPLLVVIALAIKLDSPGPIFCQHERLSFGGRRVGLLKFRTIMHDPQRTRSMSRQDTHFTRVGSFLRYIGIDGLPQLVNVLRGELTLIGDGNRAKFRL